MHQPADVGGELLRFRARQEHAVIQRVQKSPLGNPSSVHDQFLVHEGYLSSRAAEADEAELEPKGKGLPEAHRLRVGIGALDGVRIRLVHGLAFLYRRR